MEKLKTNIIRLFSYKMTDDNGFAPNPFHGFMTLATCKQGIRRTKNIGDWIAGFTSHELNGDHVGNERLIFLMKVTNKIDFSEYWNNQEYKAKKPILNSSDFRFRCGDNIYRPLKDCSKIWKDFEQKENNDHCKEHMEDDLKGEYILISTHFFYFGGLQPLEVPKELRPNVPRSRTAYGSLTENPNKFISYVERKFKMGLNNRPYKWDNNDLSWKKDKSFVKL